MNVFRKASDLLNALDETTKDVVKDTEEEDRILAEKRAKRHADRAAAAAGASPRVAFETTWDDLLAPFCRYMTWSAGGAGCTSPGCEVNRGLGVIMEPLGCSIGTSQVEETERY